jgi:hypothetical protein
MGRAHETQSFLRMLQRNKNEPAKRTFVPYQADADIDPDHASCRGTDRLRRTAGDCSGLMTSRGCAKWGRWWALPMMVLALGLSLATPARADWEYARWGMSVAEVIAASRGRATKTTPLEQGPSLISTGYFLARAQHPAAGTQFDVKFYFKEGKLSAVAVSPKRRPSSLSLGRSCSRTSGSRAQKRRSPMEWGWRKRRSGATPNMATRFCFASSISGTDQSRQPPSCTLLCRRRRAPESSGPLHP